ncbi:MAG TPA: hypothetical protein VIE44_11635 [Methylomirabilota bacterium]
MSGEMAGFLGAGAPWRADVILVVEVGMGVALGAGALLARRGRITVHACCQSAVVVLNLILVSLVMGPPSPSAFDPTFPPGCGTATYMMASVHAGLGVLALYVILAAATLLLPARFRPRRYSPWMRSTLAFSWLALLFGVATYLVWYGAPLTPPALSR